MAIDLSKLTLSELVTLQKGLALEVPRRMLAEKQQVLADLKKMAEERGFSLHDLLGGKSPKAAKAEKADRAPAAVKYRLDDKEWSGRGRKPQWVNDHLAKGGKLEDLQA